MQIILAKRVKGASHLAGVTMMELLLAMLIISILSLVSVPIIRSFILNYKISSNGDNLYYYLQYAKTEAVKRNSNVYVSFNVGDTWCYGVNVGSTCDCTQANNCGLATVSYGTAQQQSLTATGLTNNSIYFEGTHGASSASATATFTKYGASSPLITVNIGRMGSLTICSTGLGGYTAC